MEERTNDILDKAKRDSFEVVTMIESYLKNEYEDVNKNLIYSADYDETGDYEEGYFPIIAKAKNKDTKTLVCEVHAYYSDYKWRVFSYQENYFTIDYNGKQIRKTLLTSHTEHTLKNEDMLPEFMAIMLTAR